MGATRNKATGAYKYVLGKLLRAIGRHTDDKSLQARGWTVQAQGGARYGAGKAQDKVDDLKS